MASVKPLHLAKTLEELNKKVDKSDKLKQSTPKLLCRLADKVLLKAQDELLNGDEEQAYILYMRFIDTYKIIVASKEYKRDKEELKKLLPTSKVTKALDKAEALSKQLEERYAALNSDPGGGAESKEDQVVPSSPKSHPQPSQSTGLGDKDKGSTSQGNASLHPVTPKELYQLLTQQSDNVLVLDCRPRSEFNASHPDTKKFPQWLCLPEEMVRNGVNDSAIMSFLPVAGKERWRRRGSVGVVVLVDDHSTMDKLGDPLLTLKDALALFGSPPMTSDLAVLDGGYGLWHVTYGVTCVGKYRKQPTDHAPSSLQSSSSSGNEATPSMDYPAFPDMPAVEIGKGSSDEEDEDEEEDTTPSKGAVLKGTPASIQTTPTPMETDAQFGLSSSSTMLPPGFVGVPAPLPLPPTTIPVALSLEGESGLIAPTLSSTDDLYTNYPQLLMGGGIEEEPEEVETFTEPVQGHYGQQQQQQTTGYPQPMEQQQQQYTQQPQPMEYQPHPQQQQHQPHFQQQQQPMEYQPHPQQVQQGAGQQHHFHSVDQQSHVQLQPQPYPQVHSQPAGPHPQPHPQFASPQPGGPQPAGPQPHPQSHPQPAGPQPHLQQLPQPVGPQSHLQPHSQSLGPHQQPYPQTVAQASGGQQIPNLQQVPQQATPQDTRSNQDPRQVPQNPHWSSDGQAPPTVHATPTHPEAQPAAASQVHPGGASPPTQPHLSRKTLPTQSAVANNPPGTVHGTPIQRITSGPMPHPPSYDTALTLPSLPPPEQPLPPPVSTLRTPQGQPGHVTESSGHVTASSNQPTSSSGGMTESKDQVPGHVMGAAEKAAVSEASSQLKEVMKLKSQMESEMARLATAREEQEAAARRLAQEQAELQAQREQHQRTMEQERKDFERMKKQYEQVVGSMVAEKQRYLQLQEAEKKKAQERGSTLEQQLLHNKALAARAGLPEGWEKRLDQKTGRYYYVDHSTQTTHWNPPTHLINYQRQQQDEAIRRQQMQDRQFQDRRLQDEAVRRQNEAMKIQQLQDKQLQDRRLQEEAFRKQQEELQRRQLQQQQTQQQNRVPTPGHVTGATPPTGHTPSNLTQPSNQSTPSLPTPTSQVTTPIPPQQQPQPPPQQVPSATPKQSPPSSKPVVDRSVKPSIPSVDRSSKPLPALWSPQEIKLKEGNLQPVFGSERQLLTGLRNLGNTCFMNSTLQCLSHTAPVMPYFTSHAFQRDINYTNPIGHKGVVAKEFAWLVKALWSGRYRSITPRDFKSMVDASIPDMQGHAQQDANEFLAFLMNELHEDLNRVRDRVYVPEPDNSKMEEKQMAALAWSNHIKRNNSVIVDYFQGMYRSTVVCLHCKKRSITFEPFMYLSLPIPPGQRSYTLQDCLRLFSEQETVAWSCSSCKRSSGASKKIEIWKVPAILLIALSRFTNDGMWKEKRQNYIDYPVGKSLLNLSSFVVGVRPRVGYRLYAVSNHFGTQSGGHYTACCLNPFNQTYYNFDDHDVKEATAKQVKSGAGYLLFYTSLEHQPPRAKF